MIKTHSSFAMLLVAANWSQATTAQTVRDSAGVRIVENARPLWNPTERWHVVPASELEIGVESGDPMYEFATVVGVIRLDDGKLVVADRRAGEVRVFAASGEFIAKFGRSGGGPGEFRDITALWVSPSGEVAVMDGLNRRITYLDEQYQLSRTLPLPGRILPFGQVRGRWLAVYEGLGAWSPADVGKTTHFTFRYTLHDLDGEFLEELAVTPGAEQYGFAFGGSMSAQNVPFAVWPSHAVGPDVIAVGSGREPEFTMWTPATGGKTVVRWAGPERRKATDWIDAYLEELLASARTDNDRRYWRQFVREAPLPQYLPFYQDLLVDQAGHVWVERYRASGETTPTWEVFRGDGAWLGSVETPQRFQIMEIGPDYLAGVFRDDLDVQYVRIYALVKRGR